MTDLQEKKFNRIFSAFILIGMIAVTLVVNALKLSEPDTVAWKLAIVTVGAVMGVCTSVLSANGLIWNFLFGVVNVSICAYTNFDSGNMGQFLLHTLYFLPMQFVGVWQWRKRGASGSSSAPEARRLNARQWAWVAAGIVAGTALVYALLYYVDVARLGADAAPERGKILLDALVVVLNIIGQILLSLAFADSWYIWNLVNVFSIALWINRAAVAGSVGYAPVMIVKYSFYLLNSLNGLRIWLNLSRKGEENGR